VTLSPSPWPCPHPGHCYLPSSVRSVDYKRRCRTLGPIPACRPWLEICPCLGLSSQESPAWRAESPLIADLNVARKWWWHSCGEFMNRSDNAVSICWHDRLDDINYDTVFFLIVSHPTRQSGIFIRRRWMTKWFMVTCNVGLRHFPISQLLALSSEWCHRCAPAIYRCGL